MFRRGKEGGRRETAYVDLVVDGLLDDVGGEEAFLNEVWIDEISRCRSLCWIELILRLFVQSASIEFFSGDLLVVAMERSLRLLLRDSKDR